MAGRKKHRYRKPLTTLAYKDPKPLVRRKKPTGSLSVDPALLEALRTPLNGNHLKPNGKCHDCGRDVTGERKFCGTCLSHHQSH